MDGIRDKKTTNWFSTCYAGHELGWREFQFDIKYQNLVGICQNQRINQNYRRHGEQITLFPPQIYFINKTEKYENNSSAARLEFSKLVARLSFLMD